MAAEANLNGTGSVQVGAQSPEPLRVALGKLAAAVQVVDAYDDEVPRQSFWDLFGAASAVLAAHPVEPAPSDSVQISMVDIAAEAREMYGEHADEIAGRKLPEHEWRFELLFSDGGRASMHFGATADDLHAYIERLRRERS